MHRQIRGAIFDLDGTLLDSMGVWREVDVAFLGKRGFPLTESYSRAVQSMGFQEAAVYTKELYGLTDTTDEILSEWHAMVVDAYAHRIRLKPGAAGCLRALRAAGVKLALATASEPALYGPALKNNGVYGLFDSYTTLHEVSRGKGFPDIYLRAAEKLGLPAPQCAVFEDLPEGLRAVRAAGMTAVAVYDSLSPGRWEDICSLADLSVLDFTQFRPELLCGAE